MVPPFRSKDAILHSTYQNKFSTEKIICKQNENNSNTNPNQQNIDYVYNVNAQLKNNQQEYNLGQQKTSLNTSSIQQTMQNVQNSISKLTINQNSSQEISNEHSNLSPPSYNNVQNNRHQLKTLNSDIQSSNSKKTQSKS